VRLLLLAALLAPCAALAQPNAAETFELDSFRWQAEATPQPAVVATNEWGDLRVRTTERGALAVSAMIQKIGATRDEFEIRIDEGRDRVVVKVLPLVARPRGRVDLTLMIPPGKRLEAATRDGLAEIKYRGDVRTRTRGGPIAIDTPAHASARSQTGSITAKLSGEAWRRPVSLTSGSGSITIWLPERANLVLRVDTGGGIDVGFPHKIADSGRDRSRVETTIGQGGAQLRIESGSGDVRVEPYAARRRASF
jgi:hypothetical protein